MFVDASIFAVGAVASELCCGTQCIRSIIVFEMQAGPPGRRISDLCSVIHYGGFRPDLKRRPSLFSHSSESEARTGIRLTEPTGEGQTYCEFTAHRRSSTVVEARFLAGVLERARP